MQNNSHMLVVVRRNVNGRGRKQKSGKSDNSRNVRKSSCWFYRCHMSFFANTMHVYDIQHTQTWITTYSPHLPPIDQSAIDRHRKRARASLRERERESTQCGIGLWIDLKRWGAENKYWAGSPLVWQSAMLTIFCFTTVSAIVFLMGGEGSRKSGNQPPRVYGYYEHSGNAEHIHNGNE